VLDILAANGIEASFGITGRWAEAHPELVQRIVGEGHQVMNHTYDHASFTGRSTGTAPLTAQQRVSELVRAADAIRAAAGVTGAPWFRPPYGDRDASVDNDVADAGYPLIAMWSVDSLGWNGLPQASIVTRCLDAAAPGTIYLFHVGSQSADARALPAIIDGLRSRGYGFTTLAAAVPG
jgi:peptidoglycan/xylan/chitin deacetylase (PgdA/CDA1 family)